MKKLLLILISFTYLFTSCDDDFLNRTPLDAVTAIDYFNSPDELRTYMNQFYNGTNFPRYANHGSDFDSDNQIGLTVSQLLEGSRVVRATGSMGFNSIRNVNYFFDNYRKVEQSYPFEAYQQFVGEAYFFRGLMYFNLMRSYGDIQIITTELGTSSSELFSPRNPRNEVADFIIGQLDSAALYLTAEKTSGAGRVNRWMALLIQSRVALYEGTWEKYHSGTDFGVSQPNTEKYFTKAALASRELIDSGPYAIYSTGSPQTDYKDLFALQDFSSNSEVMFWRRYDNELTRGDAGFTNDRNFRMETPLGRTLTKELADAYLAADGNPIAISPLFRGYDNLRLEAADRDPRFYQTIATPDDVWKIHQNGNIQYWSEAYAQLNTTGDYNAPGGYIIQKGYNPNMIYHVQQYEESPGLIYRYAEALLNYAEARAELGLLTQEDLDISIKPLRDRVGMPGIDLAHIAADPNWDFPNLSPLINEIRRERRVELAAEGFRWDDIARWAAAEELLIGKRPRGFRASQISVNPFPIDEQGFLDPFRQALPNGYRFREERDYLMSIPISELVLNPNLSQNPGW